MTPVPANIEEPVAPLLIVGIGNILLQDDGFGPQAIAKLQSEYEIGGEAELLDVGTPALDFVDYLVGRETVILLDALSSGGEPGDVLIYEEEQLRRPLPGMRLSAHQPCLHETLFAAEASGLRFKQLRLIGVVGATFEVGTELSGSVRQGMSSAIDLVLETLRLRGVRVRRRKDPSPNEWWNFRSERPASL